MSPRLRDGAEHDCHKIRSGMTHILKCIGTLSDSSRKAVGKASRKSYFKSLIREQPIKSRHPRPSSFLRATAVRRYCFKMEMA